MSNQRENEALTPQELREALMAELEATRHVVAQLSEEELATVAGGRGVPFSPPPPPPPPPVPTIVAAHQPMGHPSAPPSPNSGAPVPGPERHMSQLRRSSSAAALTDGLTSHLRRYHEMREGQTIPAERFIPPWLL